VRRRGNNPGATQPFDWRACVTLFLKVFIGCAAAVYLFVLLIDPYAIVPFSLPMERRIVSISQRHMYPMIARSGRYDSLVIGTSTARLLDPKRLDRSFGAHFANLAMDAATAWEQAQVLDFFRRVTGPPKVLIVALDAVWCDPEADKKRITFRGFPAWLYDDNRWNDYLYLFNVGAVEVAGRLLGYKLGLYPERVRFDGYEVFLPPEDKYDPVRARDTIWHSRPRIVPSEVAPLVLEDVERAGLSFPATEWLDHALTSLPDRTEKILAWMPIHIASQPVPGSHRAAVEAECKTRIVEIGRRHAAKVIDWRISSALTRNDNNYWDSLHYRIPIATAIAEQLGPAVREGRESPDASYRLLVR
jgi:hypothetical protein